MPTKSETPPEIFDDYLRYVELNPAYAVSDDMDQGIREEIMAVLYKDKPFVMNRRIREAQIVVKSKIAQLTGNAIWSEKGPATPEEWEKSPRTLIKTLIEVLCHPSERMAFNIEELERPGAVNEIIKSIPIDPRRISDNLLESLGLYEYVCETGASREARLARRVEAIPAIREMLEGIEPVRMTGEEDFEDLEINYFRMMRIGKGKNRGKILRTKQDGKDKIVYVTDVMRAERSKKKIETNYDKEVEKLTQINIAIENVHERLGHWSDVKQSGELAELKGKLLKVVESLESVRDEDKIDYRDKISRCLTLKDRSGKLNPGAMRAALVVTRKFLDRRLKSIGRNRSVFSKDNVVARSIVRDEAKKAPMSGFKKIVEAHDGGLIIFRDEPPGTEEKERIIGNLRRVQEAAKQVKYEPFLSFAEKLMEQIEKVITALNENRNDSAKKEFMKAYLVAKIYDVFLALLRIYRKISLGEGGLNLEKILGQLGNVHREFNKHKVTTHIETSEYDNAFTQIHILLNEIRDKLMSLIYEDSASSVKPRLKKQFTSDERTECIKEIKGMINEFNFSKFIRELPENMPEATGGSAPSSQPSSPPIL